jgi:hypothetical protein
MRQLYSLLVAALGTGVGATATLAADPGQLHKVSLKDPPAAVTVRVEDLLELDYMYPVVPGQMPSDLRVEVSGHGVGKVGVVRVPHLTPDGKPIIGAGILAAFLKADKPGEVKVKVTPTGVEKPTTAEFRVKVEAK